MDTLLAIPFRREAVSLLSALGKRGLRFQKTSSSSYVANGKGSGVRMIVTGPGSRNCQEKLANALGERTYGKVLGLGCAVGLDKRLNINDVVIADQILEKREGDSDLQVYKVPKSLTIANEHGILGAILNVEKLITFKEIDQLHRETGALAACWEAAGGAKAAQVFDRPYYEIRGITDFGDCSLKQIQERLPEVMDRVAEVFVSYFLSVVET